jgi:hypothetical protein
MSDDNTLLGDQQAIIRPSGPTLYCPKCEYILTGTEEAGLRCCPECGAPLDFDDLRRKARVGLDLTYLSYWQLCWKLFVLRRRFRKQLREPSYFVRLPEVSVGFRRAVGLLAAASLAVSVWIGIGADGPHKLWAAVPPAWMLVALVVQVVTEAWFRWLLGTVKHPNVERAVRQVMAAGSSVYVPMGAGLLVAMVFVGGMTTTDWPTWPGGFATLGIGVAATAGLFSWVLWHSWAIVAQMVFRCETYYLECPLHVRWLVSMNPPAMVALMPLLLVASMCVLGSIA